MEIRMVLLDIDGTLVHQRRLVPSAHRVIAGLRQNGLEVALCTGRSVLHARQVQEVLGVEHCVYFNGALASSRGRIIQAMPLPNNVVQRMIGFTRQHNLPLILHTTDRAISLSPIPKPLQPLLDSYDFSPIEVVDEYPLSDRPTVFQSNVLVTPDWDEEIQRQLPECLLYRWDWNAIDLQQGACDKSVGAHALLTYLGIKPEQAVHIGDGGNDIPLFRQVGISVAMGNAAAPVRQQASFVTKSVEEDGVLHACLTLGLL
ncbi:MAG: HAD family hydrolase [Alicyclobacillus shizuokensis]|nr:HAD family hydrolase [Alicyclobacillus shizuokensis]